MYAPYRSHQSWCGATAPNALRQGRSSPLRIARRQRARLAVPGCQRAGAPV